MMRYLMPASRAAVAVTVVAVMSTVVLTSVSCNLGVEQELSEDREGSGVGVLGQRVDEKGAHFDTVPRITQRPKHRGLRVGRGAFPVRECLLQALHVGQSDRLRRRARAVKDPDDSTIHDFRSKYCDTCWV